MTPASSLAPDTTPSVAESPAKLPEMAAAGLASWLNQGETTGPSAAQNQPPQAIEEQRLLRFSLQGSESALLPLSSIQEVLQVPKQGLLPVPAMPPSILGVSNCRGSILWMVDLPLLLGLESTSASQSWPAVGRAQQSLNIITIQAAGESLGLVVPKVMDIETHATRQIQPPSADLFSSQLLPFLAGYLTQSCSPVFSASALIEHLQLQR